MKALNKFEGVTTDYSVHGLVEVPMAEPAPSRPPKVARELAEAIMQAQANFVVVLERIAEATKRGLNDSVGTSIGSGEAVGGTRDFTQQMLDKIAEQEDDDARQHLALLVAAVGAARDWSQRAKTETFRLTPITEKKAKQVLGEGPAQCINKHCGRDVWCTPQDRYLACRCEPCYRYWDRHDRMEERPKALCDATNLVHVDKKSATTED